MFVLLVIIVFVGAGYLALCADRAIPDEWNVFRGIVPLKGYPTTNGLILGLVIAVLLLAIQ